MPLARDLTASGFALTGVDIGAVQVERARRLVLGARFLHADVTGAVLGSSPRPA